MSSEQLDYYAVLNVSPRATQGEIDHAYRVLLRRHHPDSRPPASETSAAEADAALQQVLSAYAVLRDPTQRARYDQKTRRQPQPRSRPSAHPLQRDRVHERPPIVAGPVYWRPTAPRQ